MSEHSDNELMAALGRAFARYDPPPDHVLEHARQALTWRSFDAELAELVYDSADAGQPALVRGDTREITFRAPGLEVEVMMLSEQRRTLLGQVVPAQQASVELRHGGRTARTRTDALGRFSFTPVTTGAVTLVVRTDAGAQVQTEGLVL